MCKLIGLGVVGEGGFNKSFLRKVLHLVRLRFVGFSIVGGLVFLFGIGVLAFQVEVLHVSKILAGILTTVISVEINFLLNKYINWRDRQGGFGIQWLKFHATRIGMIIINQLLYTLFVSLGFNYLLVSTALTIVVTVVNYFGSDRFAFKERVDGNTT